MTIVFDDEVNLISCALLDIVFCIFCFFFFQAEDGIRDLVRSRGSEMCIRDRFIGKPQLSAIGTGIRGEEGQFFKDKLIEVAKIIPVSYTHLKLPTSDLV